MPLITRTVASALKAPTDTRTVPFASGGFVVRVTAVPEVVFSVPIPPRTAQEYVSPGIELFHAS